MRNTFKAYERLKREQHIDTLFRTGKAFSVFPIRVIWRLVPGGATDRSPVLAGFSVPKKKFPRSVDRHRVRRLVVEAWRTGKQPVYEAIPAGCQLHLFIIFTDAALPEYDAIKSALAKATEKLTSMIMDHDNTPPPIPTP